MDSNFLEVTYGNAHCHELINTNMANALINKLTKYYKLEVDRSYGKYFKFADKSDNHSLRSERHLCYFNVNEPQVLLYLTKFNGINFCFYIDVKRGKIFSVKHRFSDSLYESDTLFEGKVVTGKESYYLISDIVIYQNRTQSTDLLTRLRLMNQIVNEMFVEDEILDPFKIRVQDFVDYQYLESFIVDYLPTLPYKKSVTGFIFRPLVGAKNLIYLLRDFHNGVERKNQNVSPGPGAKLDFDPSFNNTTRETVCFRVQKTKKPDVYELYLVSNASSDGLHYCGVASVPTMESSKEIKNMYQNHHHYVIANCKWDSINKRWQPYRKSSRKQPDSVYIFKMY